MPLDRSQWPESLISAARNSAWVVCEVFDDSPAQQLGIEPGWLLLHVDGEPASKDRVDQARLGQARSLAFLTGAGAELAMLSLEVWPNGLRLLPAIDEALNLEVRCQTADLLMLHEIWTHWRWQDYAALTPDLEMALLPLGDRLTGFLRSKAKKHQRRLEVQHTTYQQLLALAYLAEGRMAEAGDLLRAAQQSYAAEGEPPMPSCYFALELFIETMLLYHGGDVPQAKERALLAMSHYAEFPAICALYSEVCRQRPVIPFGPHLQKRFPIRYRFERHDVHGRFSRPGEFCDLQASLDGMGDDQLLFVYLMGPYRMNGPYEAELIGLRSLARGMPEQIAAVHVISERQEVSAYWQGKTAIEDAIADNDLDYQIGLDRDAGLAEALGVEAFPTLFVLNRAGVVLAEGSLSWEQAFWQGLQRSKDADFLAAAPQ